MSVCDKHDKTMGRLFDDINDLKLRQAKGNAEISAFVKEIKDFKDKLHEAIYGNGKEGLLTRVSKMTTQVNLQWTLLILILGAVIGFALNK